LIEGLNLSSEKYVLNLGCGFGKTTEYVVRRFGCHITASDILKKVVKRAEKRALEGGWRFKAQFKVLDPQNLIFEEEAFDAILVETFTTFVKDKRRVAKEYARALRKRGRIGMVELVWLKKPPRELSDGIEMKFGVEASFLTDEEWRNLFNTSGLQLEKSRIYRLSLLQKWLGDFRYDTFKALFDLLRTIYTVITIPAARRITEGFLSTYRDYSEFTGFATYIYSKHV